MTTLIINIRHNADDSALANFPFLPEQHIIDEQYGDACVVEIDLAGHADTTAAQEQYLNTNDAVVGYEVREAE